MDKFLAYRLLTFIPTRIAISIVVFAILALTPDKSMGEFALGSIPLFQLNRNTS